MYEDEDFADLFPSRGQLADAPWRLALVTFMQYAKGLTDCQAADAIRTRIDWKYVLSSLELTDSGFDFSVLSEFLGRMLVYGAERRLFDQLLDIWRERGWIKSHGKQRTASTYVLAAIRTLRRLEGVGKTMRHALNVLAEVAPSWLLSHMDQEWVERYEKRFSDFRLPKEEKKRVDLAERIGTDGRRLLELVYADSRFLIDWQAKQVVCPAGHTSRDWDHIPDRHGKPSLRVHFPLRLCRSCPLHAHCTPIVAEALILRPDEASYNAHQQARSRQTAPDFRSRYAKRAGVEGTVAQAIRACKMRRARYLGSKKLRLQAFVTATALNVLRACDWLVKGTHASPPVSHLARLLVSAKKAAIA